jgi:DNA-binding IclR family transcriptional regulator
VYGVDGAPLGALSVAGPASRLPEERLFEVGQQVAATARTLSERFGYGTGGA